MLRKHHLISLFELFIKESRSGKRLLQKNGTRIKPQSVNNYTYVLLLLKEFRDAKKLICTCLNSKASIDKREFEQVKKYGTRFKIFEKDKH